MTRYFRLVDEVAIPNRWHLGAASLADGAEPRLSVGLRFESLVAPSIPVTRAGRTLDFSLTSFAVPVATRELADAVERVAGGDVQCIPVVIPGRTDMRVLNAVRIVRCVDEERSEFIKWTERDHRADLAGQYRQITTLVLDAAAIPADARFFRLEGSPVKLVVSEDTKAAMETVGCLGAKFIPLPVSGPRLVGRA